MEPISSTENKPLHVLLENALALGDKSEVKSNKEG